ncbi:MAG: class I SAM-dependent methyltransferase [Thermoplasmata archaeon]
MGAIQEYLYHVVRLSRPLTVVETGVYRGVSTSFILAALSDNGRGTLYSIDLPSASYSIDELSRSDRTPLHGRETPGFAVPQELMSRWKLTLGDTRVILPRILQEVGPIDLFLHDSEHTYECMSWEYQLALASIAPHGILASDDINWNNAFQDLLESRTFAWSGSVSNKLGLVQV